MSSQLLKRLDQWVPIAIFGGGVLGSIIGAGYGCTQVPDERHNDLQTSMGIVSSFAVMGGGMGMFGVTFSPVIIPAGILGGIAHMAKKSSVVQATA